jgi:glycosyltransferase involved in cell wall biosynthesis
VNAVELPSSSVLPEGAPPAVSVIVPVYNSARSLTHAIAAVSAQTFGDWELIIIDDASTDDVAGAVASAGDDARIRLIRHATNAGATAARNTGIAAARGRFVAFLDADDGWQPTKLEQQMATVMARPDPDRVFCVTRSIVTLTPDRFILSPHRPKAPGERMDEFIFVHAGFCQTSSFFLSRAIAAQIGFRELPIGEDHLFAIDACDAGAEYVMVDEPLSIYNDEVRPGRLSNERSLERGYGFMAAVKHVLSPKALMAYEARSLGVMLLRRNPITGIAKIARAVWAGALPVRYALSLIARAVVPARLYGAVRARLLGHLLSHRRRESSEA